MTPEELFEKILIETPIKGVARKARILELIRQFKKEWCIEFGLWVRRNVNKENFDFSEGDTNGWYDEWIKEFLNAPEPE